MKVRFSRGALADLGGVTEYLIANLSEKAARRIAADLRAAGQEIGRYPKANAIVATYAGRPLHRRRFKRWAILYHEADGEIVIVRIADGAQGYLAWFEP